LAARREPAGRAARAALKGLSTGKPGRQTELLFPAARRANGLARIPKLIARLAARGALWVVYPKSSRGIREAEVIQAGREAGLKDSEVTAFSVESAALSFQRPATR